MTTAGPAVSQLLLRQLRRGTLAVAATAAGMSALVAAQYDSMFGGTLGAPAVQALAENPAIRILFGPPLALDSAGGFTVWRTGTPILLLASVWILLATTRITRGDEEAGRWQLLLAGRLRIGDVVGRCLVAVTVSATVIGAAVVIALLATGTGPIGAVIYGVGVAGVALTFATVGLLFAQVLPTRSAAVGAAVAAVGFAQLVRMLADGVPALAWSAWSSPFGLLGRAAPYAHDRVLPLVVLAAYPVVFGVAALLTAGHRDLDGGLVTVATSRAPRTRMLGSVGAFAVRRSLPITAGWAAGIGAYFLLIGAVIASIIDFLTANPRFAELAAAAGFVGLSSPAGLAGALFSLLSVPTGLYAMSRLSALVSDERARRWTLLFATPVPRNQLAGTEIAVTAAGVMVLHTVAGVAMAAGAAITGGHLGLAPALAGALNTVPIAWLALGAAALALGWLPSWVGFVGALPVVGGFLWDVLADTVHAPEQLAALSPFKHLSRVPLEPPDWGAVAALTTIAVLLAVSGIAGYRRRDLTT